MEDLQRFKLPNVASEVLTTDIQGVSDVICEKESLDMIWGILENEAPLNPLLASYFAKIVKNLLNRRPDQITQYIYESEKELFNLLISHMATSAVMDLLRVMTTMDTGANEIPLNLWLARDKQLVAVLTGIFDVATTGADEEMLSNSATLMADLINDGRKEAIDLQEMRSLSPFLHQLESEEFLGGLLDNLLTKGDAATLQLGLPVLLTLLGDTNRGEDEQPPSLMDDKRHQEEVKCVMKSLVPRMSSVHALLETVDPESGALRLGSVRLQAARILEMMCTASFLEVEEELVALGSVPRMMALFEQFPENNFLHKFLESIVANIFKHPPKDVYQAPLMKQLLVDSKFLEFVERCFMLNEADERNPQGHRRGYMGHLVTMAIYCNEAFVRSDPSLFDLYFPAGDEPAAAARAAWDEFKGVYLEPLIKKWHTELGGHRPRGSMGDSSEDDDDNNYLQDAGGADVAYANYRTQQVGIDPNDFDDEDDENSDDDDDESYGNSIDIASTGASVSRFGTGTMVDFSSSGLGTDDGPAAGDGDWKIEGDAVASTGDGPVEASTPTDVPAGDLFAGAFGPTPAGESEATDGAAAAKDPFAGADPFANSSKPAVADVGDSLVVAPDGGGGSTATESTTDGDAPLEKEEKPPNATVEIEGGGNLFASSA
jgi:serine/threonine-protein phosphatase 6 regulatory subunit 3